jgi:hypothetical protein
MALVGVKLLASLRVEEYRSKSGGISLQVGGNIAPSRGEYRSESGRACALAPRIVYLQD